MESKRQQKISRLLLKDLGEIFQRESSSIFRQNAMVSVTKIYVTRDLSQAKVFLSLFAVEDKEELFKEIKSNTKTIRTILAQRIKNQLRVVPELIFYLDDSLDYIERIEDLLNE